MVDLALRAENEQIPLNVIAERQGISVNYLEHIFSSLKKAGIVKSIKGPQGGYMLADKPAKIIVGDVIRALEGDIRIVKKETEGDLENPIERCLFTNLWDKIDYEVNKIIDQTTLEDIVNCYQATQYDGMMFHI